MFTDFLFLSERYSWSQFTLLYLTAEYSCTVFICTSDCIYTVLKISKPDRSVFCLLQFMSKCGIVP
jgi:hypothetical protein